MAFVTDDTGEPKATRAGLSRARRWALENNGSGRTVEVIDQLEEKRTSKLHAIIAEYSEEEAAVIDSKPKRKPAKVNILPPKSLKNK